MPFIDFKCIDVQSLDESSTITAEEIQQDKAVRQSNFMRALEMANTIIDHNPEVLVFYWYMWTCRDRTYSNSLPPEQITRRTVKRMPVPTEEEQLCMKQHTKLFTAVLRSDRINYAGQVLYANTKALIQLQIEFSNHIFIIDDDNSRLLFIMNSNIVQPIVSTNLFKVNHSSLWSSPSTMSSQCVNPPHVVNGQAPLIRFQILNAAQSSSFGTKAARIIMTSPNSTSNTHIQSSLDHSRLATLKVDVPKQISPSRIDIPILKANNVKTLDDLDISPHFIKPISQSTPSSSEKRKTKQIEEPASKTAKRCKNWSEEETNTFISVWSDYYSKLTTGGARNAPIYNTIAKQLNEMLPSRTLTGHEVKAKIGNLVGEYRRKKKEMGKTGASPPSWPFYNSIDKLIGERPYNDDSLLSDSMIMQEEEGQLFSMANGGADTCISTQYGAESKELIDLENIEDSSIVDQECDEKKRSSLGPDCVLKSNPVVKNGEKKNLNRKKKASELKFDMIQDLLKKIEQVNDIASESEKKVVELLEKQTALQHESMKNEREFLEVFKHMVNNMNTRS
ncbi:unnamed protein product [Rotaria socialis]|uniref:Myb/SANT-like DNA-binding domain-containing protein n=2 Tax=Rotaria socialis TaxID=392032 RepID=A0A818KEN7_9BILA|nr:unnamed protein product [Rotaria socialis]